MAEDFQKLEIWKEGYKLSLLVYRLSSEFPKSELYGLTSQIRRSSVSNIANIAEACGRYYKKDKARTLFQSRGEIEKIKSHLLIAKGLGYGNPKQIDDIFKRYCVLVRRLNAFIRTFTD